MNHNIEWDPRTPVHEPEGFYLRVRTGISVMFQNRLEVMRSTGAFADAQRIEQAIVGSQPQLADIAAQSDGVGIPNRVSLRFETQRGVFECVLLWGIVLNGGRRKKAKTGDWIFIIGMAEQEADLLKQVFRVDDAVDRAVSTLVQAMLGESA